MRKIFTVSVVVFFAVSVWAAFDLHHRLAFVMFAQAGVLFSAGILKLRRR